MEFLPGAQRPRGGDAGEHRGAQARQARQVRPGRHRRLRRDDLPLLCDGQEQNIKKEEQKKLAEAAQITYDKLNYKDDQFDLAEASIAIAIALLAITALTHIWWLFWLAMIPSVFGFLIGGAGLLGLPFHPDFLSTPLT